MKACLASSATTVHNQEGNASSNMVGFIGGGRIAQAMARGFITSGQLPQFTALFIAFFSLH